MAIKEITEIKKIQICDNCEQEGIWPYHADNKELCHKCYLEYKKDFTKKCQHENYIIDLSGSVLKKWSKKEGD